MHLQRVVTRDVTSRHVDICYNALSVIVNIVVVVQGHLLSNVNTLIDDVEHFLSSDPVDFILDDELDSVERLDDAAQRPGGRHDGRCIRGVISNLFLEIITPLRRC